MSINFKQTKTNSSFIFIEHGYLAIVLCKLMMTMMIIIQKFPNGLFIEHFLDSSFYTTTNINDFESIHPSKSIYLVIFLFTYFTGISGNAKGFHMTKKENDKIKRQFFGLLFQQQFVRFDNHFESIRFICM